MPWRVKQTKPLSDYGISDSSVSVGVVPLTNLIILMGFNGAIMTVNTSTLAVDTASVGGWQDGGFIATTSDGVSILACENDGVVLKRDSVDADVSGQTGILIPPQLGAGSSEPRGLYYELATDRLFSFHDDATLRRYDEPLGWNPSTYPADGQETLTVVNPSVAVVNGAKPSGFLSGNFTKGPSGTYMVPDNNVAGRIVVYPSIALASYTLIDVAGFPNNTPKKLFGAGYVAPYLYATDYDNGASTLYVIEQYSVAGNSAGVGGMGLSL